MTTSVVVVSYRMHRWLEPCLESVTDQADEVILVDNGSPEGVVAAAGRRCGVDVAVVGENRGFAAGVNAGLRRAKGDLVAVLNDDAVAEPGWVSSAAEALENPAVAAVAPKILFPWPFAEIRFTDERHFAPGDPRPLGRTVERFAVAGREVPLGLVHGPGLHEVERGERGGSWREWRWTTGTGSVYVPVLEAGPVTEVEVDGEAMPVAGTVDLVSCAGSYLSARGHGGDFGFGARDGAAFDEPAEHFAASGAAMVIRADAFARIGGFAESYFAYYEDLDWCWRARLAGFRIAYEPAGVVRHVGGASTGGPASDRVRFLAARNRIQTLARNAPLSVLWPELRSRVNRPDAMAKSIVGRAGRGLLERRALARRWRERPAQVWAAWAGRDEHWPGEGGSGS